MLDLTDDVDFFGLVLDVIELAGTVALEGVLVWFVTVDLEGDETIDEAVIEVWY